MGTYINNLFIKTFDNLDLTPPEVLFFYSRIMSINSMFRQPTYVQIYLLYKNKTNVIESIKIYIYIPTAYVHKKNAMHHARCRHRQWRRSMFRINMQSTENDYDQK